MDPIFEEFTITLKYQVTVNTDTGEMTTKCIKRTVDKANFDITDSVSRRSTKKSKREESNTPQLILEENKYYLNSAAVELMGINPDDKLDIKYEKKGSTTIPVIGSDEVFGTHNGNRVTKSFTVACRGSKNNELAKYGTTFEIASHDTKTGLFILIGDIEQSSNELEINESDEDLPLDLNIDDAEEIDSSLFQL